jgi:hypothetical protein
MSTPKDKELLSSRSSQTDIPDLEKGEATPKEETVVDTQACSHQALDYLQLTDTPGPR